MKKRNNSKENMDNNKVQPKKTVKLTKDIKISKFDDLEGKFLHVKVGTENQPATTEQIQEIEKKIVNLFNQSNINCLTFVTHHAVSMEIVERDHSNDEH